MTVINQVFDENSLKEVVKQFDHWRITRLKRGPIPDELWALIKPLETRYNLNEVAKALRVNYSQLKNRLKSLSNTSAPHSMTFVECTSHQVLPIIEPKGATLLFNCVNGRPVTLSGLCSRDIATAITSLIRG